MTAIRRRLVVGSRGRSQESIELLAAGVDFGTQLYRIGGAGQRGRGDSQRTLSSELASYALDMTTPTDRHNVARESRTPNRRRYWLAFLLCYALALSIAIVFLHEDIQTTLIGVAIFTAGWIVSAYMDARTRRDLEASASSNEPTGN
jgi:hypothetical protein